VLLLAFDTATPAVTVALHDGEQVLSAVTQVDPRRHAELLAPAIVRVLSTAGREQRELTRVAVGVGPGPFTGLRVGLTTARTLGLALGIPVAGVCTLDVIAAEIGEPDAFAVATDARRKEVYWARYERRAARSVRVAGPDVSRPVDLAAQLGEVPVFGRGGQAYADVLAHRPGPLDPDAAVLADAVVHGQIELLPPDPLYLRRPDVSAPGPRKPAS